MYLAQAVAVFECQDEQVPDLPDVVQHHPHGTDSHSQPTRFRRQVAPGAEDFLNHGERYTNRGEVKCTAVGLLSTLESSFSIESSMTNTMHTIRN